MGVCVRVCETGSMCEEWGECVKHVECVKSGVNGCERKSVGNRFFQIM